MSAPLATTAADPGGQRRLVRPDDPVGLGLSAVIHECTAADSRPAWALLAPGWAGDRCGPGEIFLPLAETLLAAPTVTVGRVLRFDVSGRGEAPGDYAASDLDAMVDDGLRALAVAALAVGADAKTPVDIHLIGMCSGGNVALGLAGLWARLAAGDESDLGHLTPEIKQTLRAVRVRSVQAVSTFPFQEMRPAELNQIRQAQNRRQTLGKLFRLESYKKLLTGRLNPTRILKNWFESEPGAGGAQGGDTGGEQVNRKQSRRDLLAGLGLYAKQYPGALQFVYADGDPEGVASIPVYEAFFQAMPATVPMRTLTGCNHNFYGRAARARLFLTLTQFCAGGSA